MFTDNERILKFKCIKGHESEFKEGDYMTKDNKLYKIFICMECLQKYYLPLFVNLEVM